MCCTRVLAFGTLPRRGVLHQGSSGTRWGCCRLAMPSHPPAVRGGTAGGGADEGCLAPTSPRDRGRIGGKFQMPEDLADHLAVRDGRDDPQRALLTHRAACHSPGKHPLEQPRPTPARRPRVRLLLVHALLTWGWGDRTAQMTVRR